MPILVVCPGCRKRFQVSDKFAGQTGGCPHCKGKITVPTKAQEVKVHAPTEFGGGGRGATGQLALQPIARKITRIKPTTAAIVAAACLVVLAATWAGGKAGLFEQVIFSALGLLLISPPLVLAPYTFLRDDELEPYRGKQLYIRAGLCSLTYIILWGVFGYVGTQGLLSDELWTWVFVAPPFLVAGALAAQFALELSFGDGFFHYCFYLLVTVLLRRLAGIGWVWEVAREVVSVS